VLLPPPALRPDDLLAVVLACVRAGDEWAPLLVEPNGTDLVAIPLMKGPGLPLGELAPPVEGGEADPPLRLADLSRELRRVRHDVNNPLGAALAEVQLLLMDAADPDLRRALETIQEQLRRIRDLLVALKLPAAG
jgi:signal transduction histidine kinase